MGMAVMVACQESEKTKDEFTGNQTIYPLVAGSQYNINGTVTFQEKNDGSTLITVALSGTEGNIEHPVHLLALDLSQPPQSLKDRRYRPGGSVNPGSHALREDAR